MWELGKFAHARGLFINENSMSNSEEINQSELLVVIQHRLHVAGKI